MADRGRYPARHIGHERATGCRDPRRHCTQAPHQHRTAAGQPDREANLPRQPNPNIGEQYPFQQKGFCGTSARCRPSHSPPRRALRCRFKHTRRHDASAAPPPNNRRPNVGAPAGANWAAAPATTADEGMTALFAAAAAPTGKPSRRWPPSNHHPNVGAPAGANAAAPPAIKQIQDLAPAINAPESGVIGCTIGSCFEPTPSRSPPKSWR